MFDTFHFHDMEEAAIFIHKELIKFDLPNNYCFTLCYTFDNEHYNIEEEIKIDDIYDNVLDNVRDLDSQEGHVYPRIENNVIMWYDIDDSQETIERGYSHDANIELAFAGEGVTVFVNEFATMPASTPFVIVKKSTNDVHREGIVKLLKFCKNNDELSSCVAPAIYISIEQL